MAGSIKVANSPLKRIDIHVEGAHVDYEKLSGDRVGESSECIRARVQAARDIQQNRFSKIESAAIVCNEDMHVGEIRQFRKLQEEGQSLMRAAMTQLNLSARAYHRTRSVKLARTIADLAGCEEIQSAHLAEALHFRPTEGDDGVTKFIIFPLDSYLIFCYYVIVHVTGNMKHKRRQVTISQVAREAGVSSQTVSRVINNRQEITPETRQHVQDVIKRLGYQPNAIARSLSQRRSHTLGVVTSGLEYYGPSHILVGVEQGANQEGLSILLNLLHQPESENIGAIVNGLISRQVEGIIWAVPEIGNNRSWFREVLPQLGIPVIFLSTQPRDDLHVVEMDNRNGGYMATQHLLERGYRRIGLIAGPLTW